MSEVELHTGILKRVDTQGLTADEWVKEWVNNYLDSTTDSYYSRHRNDPDFDYKNAFYDLSWPDLYIVTGDKIFKVYDNPHESNFICDVSKLSNGDYTYTTQFYNGGACLTEVLENELKSIEK